MLPGLSPPAGRWGCLISDPQPSDELLLQCIGRQDREAFAELYQRYSRPILAYLVRLVRDQAVAEELFQELFMVVWKDARRFRGRASVRTWLYRIAHNQAVSWLRKKRPDLTGEILPDAIQEEFPEAQVLERVRREQIAEALDQLSPDHRAVLELVFFHHMRYREVAQVMDCPEGTVKSRMSHARRHLRLVLIQMGFEG